MDVQQFYDEALTQRGFKADEAQKRREQAYEEWVLYKGTGEQADPPYHAS
jgi:cell division protein ZapE